MHKVYKAIDNINSLAKKQNEKSEKEKEEKQQALLEEAEKIRAEGMKKIADFEEDLKIKVNIFNNNQYYTYSKNYGFKKFHSYSNRKAKTIFNQEQPIWQLTESY